MPNGTGAAARFRHHGYVCGGDWDFRHDWRASLGWSTLEVGQQPDPPTGGQVSRMALAELPPGNHWVLGGCCHHPVRFWTLLEILGAFFFIS